MRMEIEHELTLSLPQGTGQTVLHLLLTPAGGPTQTVESWSVELAGIGNAARFKDAYGNLVHLVNQSRPDGDIVVRARGVVSTKDTHGVVGRPGGEPVPTLYKRVTPLTKAPDAAVMDGLRDRAQNRVDLLHALMARVGEVLGVDEAPAGQTQMQADGAPVQAQGESAPLPPAADYAHLFIAAARALDIPARYVSGYVMAGEHHQGGLHAWAEAYDEGLGWIGFDARQQICPTDRHVRLAVGLDAEGAQGLRTVPVGEIVQGATLRGA